MLTTICLAIIVPFLVWGEVLNNAAGSLIGQAQERRLMVGMALTALLATDILLPVPSSLVSTACGMTLGFVGGTAASFIGMTISVMGGYLIGRCFAAYTAKMIGSDEVVLLKIFQERYGVWLLLIMRPVPVLAEVSVLFSGLSKHPFGRMLLMTAFGNLAVSAAYAAVGVWGGLSDSFIPAFVASVALSGLLMLLMRGASRKVVQASVD
ncbi:MAG: VTT domain-containing protein [Kiritimatiellae bacterium]|nr:VTT domain-containing protein [Kiritimatiellia bacterium]